MNNLRKFCAGLILMLALSVSTFAGQIECGGVVGEPPPPPPETVMAGEMPNAIEAADPVTEILISFLTNILPLF